MERYIGLDVHAASCTLGVISESGRRLKDFPVETNGQALVHGDKHHRVVASADSDVSPREYEGWCLPTSSDILELAIQQFPTRGETPQAASPMQRYIGIDVHAASCTLAVISETGRRLKDFPVETNGQALPGRDQRPGPGRGGSHDPRPQASGLSKGAAAGCEYFRVRGCTRR
jgi:hypothetical protein